MTSVPFKVSVNDDDILEENENFVLTINHSLLPSGVGIGNPNLTTVIIMDNDRELLYEISCYYAFLMPLGLLLKYVFAHVSKL